MAADHGVVSEGVSGYPQEVTKQMAHNIASNGAGINALLSVSNSDFALVDVGISGDTTNDKLINRKIRNGTDNMLNGPAMSYDDAVKAIETGIDTAIEYIDKGYNMLGIGELGIGNTTASSAILYSYGDLNIDNVVGKGAGITEEALAHKKQVVKQSVERNNINTDDPIDVLSKVGGLEIGAMAGVILGAASRKVPIVLDGFISSAAALIAYKIAPLTKLYMIPSHLSKEQGHKWVMDMLGLKPYLNMNMGLGEGSGGAIGFSLIDMSVAMLNNMATFDGAGVSKSNH